MKWNNKEIKEQIDKFVDEHKDEEPIYKGCRNKICFCTGNCKEIIGWKPKSKDIIWIN